MSACACCSPCGCVLALSTEMCACVMLQRTRCAQARTRDLMRLAAVHMRHACHTVHMQRALPGHTLHWLRDGWCASYTRVKPVPDAGRLLISPPPLWTHCRNQTHLEDHALELARTFGRVRGAGTGMEPSLGHDRGGSLQWLPARVMFGLPRWHTQRYGRCPNSRDLFGQRRSTS